MPDVDFDDLIPQRAATTAATADVSFDDLIPKPSLPQQTAATTPSQPRGQPQQQPVKPPQPTGPFTRALSQIFTEPADRPLGAAGFMRPKATTAQINPQQQPDLQWPKQEPTFRQGAQPPSGVLPGGDEWQRELEDSKKRVGAMEASLKEAKAKVNIHSRESVGNYNKQLASYRTEADKHNKKVEDANKAIDAYARARRGEPLSADAEDALRVQKEKEENRERLSPFQELIVRPFEAQAAAVAEHYNSGMATLYKTAGEIGGYVIGGLGEEQAGIFGKDMSVSETGKAVKKSANEAVGKIKRFVDKGVDAYLSQAGHWHQIALEQGANKADELIGEALGGSVPGLAEFMMGPEWAALRGAAEAHKKGDSEIIGAIKGAAQRYVLGKTFEAQSALSQPARSIAMMATFMGQTAADGGDIDDIIKSGAIGVLYGIPGGGNIGLKDILKPLTDSEWYQKATGKEKGDIVEKIVKKSQADDFRKMMREADTPEKKAAAQEAFFKQQMTPEQWESYQKSKEPRQIEQEKPVEAIAPELEASADEGKGEIEPKDTRLPQPNIPEGEEGPIVPPKEEEPTPPPPITPEGKEAVPYDKNHLQFIRDRLQMSEGARPGTAIRDEQSNVTGRAGSPYPEWFQDKGLTKKGVTGYIDKLLNGEQLGGVPKSIIDDLIESSHKEYTQAHTENLTEFLQKNKLIEGDKIKIGDEWYEHQGFDDKGNIVLKDGRTYHIDPLGKDIFVPITDVDKGEPPKEETVKKAVVEKPKTDILHTFKNEEDGTETHVTKHERGFAVSVMGTDSGEYLSTHPIYKTESEAVKMANKIAGMSEGFALTVEEPPKTETEATHTPEKPESIEPGHKEKFRQGVIDNPPRQALADAFNYGRQLREKLERGDFEEAKIKGLTLKDAEFKPGLSTRAELESYAVRHNIDFDYSQGSMDAAMSAFGRAGFLGQPMPEYRTGWRYGKIPQSGRSYNFREQTPERGVSMMNLHDPDFSGGVEGGTYELFNRKGDIHNVGGYYIGRGTDGEPLLVDVRELPDKEPVTELKPANEDAGNLAKEDAGNMLMSPKKKYPDMFGAAFDKNALTQPLPSKDVKPEGLPLFRQAEDALQKEAERIEGESQKKLFTSEEEIAKLLLANHKEYKNDPENLRIAARAIKDLRQLELFGRDPIREVPHLRYGGDTGQGGTDGIQVLGVGISSHLIKKGAINLIGLKAETPKQIAVISQVFRDPRYETFRAIYLKDGKVVGHNAITSRVPGFVSFFRSNIVAMMRGEIANTGADGAYLLHNHPSGNPKPSGDDITTTLSLFLDIPQLRGHIIIDSDSYAVMTIDRGTGTVAQEILPLKTDNAILRSAIGHPLIGMEINTTGELANVAKQVQQPGYVTVLYLASMNNVRAIEAIPSKMIDDEKKLSTYLTDRAREFGAEKTALSGAHLGPDQLQNVKNLIMGYFTEDYAVFDDQGKSLYGVRSKLSRPRKPTALWMGELRGSERIAENERIYGEDDDKEITDRNLAKLEKEISDAYEEQKDLWLGNKDERALRARVNAANLQNEIVKALGKKKYDREAQDADKAIQLYIDTKRDPEDLGKYWDKLSDEDKRLVRMSQSLSPAIRKIADKIEDRYKDIGLEALDADVIKNVLDNYAGRVWDLGTGKSFTENLRKFGTKTRHAKHREIATIIAGKANGFKLKYEGATTNQRILEEEIVKTITDKRFLAALRAVKLSNGMPLISMRQFEGMEEIKHPNFTAWKWVGKVDPAFDEEGDRENEEVIVSRYGARNAYVSDDGNVFERRHFYAPKKQADNLNNILGHSALMDLPGVKAITKYNAIVKAWILQTSFFHHLAFTRNYFLGTPGTWKTPNIKKAYYDGLQMVMDLHPDIIRGVRAGLTLGVKQDWEEDMARSGTIFGKLLDNIPMAREVKNFIEDVRKRQATYLFEVMGAGLKAKSFIHEYRQILTESPQIDEAEAAKIAATLVNNNYGGLNLARIGRNPTLQHIFRLTLLASDWTESNLRLVAGMFQKGENGKAARTAYRRVVVGWYIKALALTAIWNFIMAGGDPDKMIENYKRAWKQNNLNWLKMNVTPIYKALGGGTENDKYFPLVGHMLDPIKLLSHPLRWIQAKSSAVSKIASETIVGEDWTHRRFSTLEELLKTGKTTHYGAGHPLDWDQFPSFILAELIGTEPVQVQNFIRWVNGELEGFDTMANSLGLGITSTHFPTGAKLKSKIRGMTVDDLATAMQSQKMTPADKRIIESAMSTKISNAWSKRNLTAEEKDKYIRILRAFKYREE